MTARHYIWTLTAWGHCEATLMVEGEPFPAGHPWCHHQARPEHRSLPALSKKPFVSLRPPHGSHTGPLALGSPPPKRATNSLSLSRLPFPSVPLLSVPSRLGLRATLSAGGRAGPWNILRHGTVTGIGTSFERGASVLPPVKWVQRSPARSKWV